MRILKGLLLLFTIQSHLIVAEPLSSHTIKLGMSTALSGPNQYLGRSMYNGMNQCFKEINSKGGIHGKPIELIVMDDSYQPAMAEANTRYLIEKQQVIAIVGNVGTPTAAVSAPLSSKSHVVFYGALTGASLLRKIPPDPYIFNYRASYQQEMNVIVQHITDSGISARRIAFVLQKDGYGDAGYKAAKNALESKGYKYTNELVVAFYERNSLETRAAIEKIIESPDRPDAIIIVGTYQASAHFIQSMYRLLPQTRFYNLSFAGAGAFAQALRGIEDRVYMTQVVPPHADDAANKNLPRDLVEREGYLSAQLFVAALKKIRGEITREALRLSLNSLQITQQKEWMNKWGVMPLVLSPQNHQATDYVVLTQLKGDSWSLVPQINRNNEERYSYAAEY